MYKCITHATMKFFNENTSGRILNRFSKDLGCVDELLPFATIDTVQVCKISHLIVHFNLKFL